MPTVSDKGGNESECTFYRNGPLQMSVARSNKGKHPHNTGL